MENRFRLLCLALGCLFFSALPMQAQTDNTAPLIYEDAWDLPPYVYLDEMGQPAGYNIDLLDLVCTELNIPYEVRLKPSSEVLADLRSGVAQLSMVVYDSVYHHGLLPSSNLVLLFTHSLVVPKNNSITFANTDDLEHMTPIVHTNSFSHHYMQSIGMEANARPVGDMKAAVQQVSSQNSGIILWNTLSLDWLVRKYQADNLRLVPMDIPHGEYRFVSLDSGLLARVDRAFANLQAAHQLDDAQNRWFYPDREDSGVPSWVWWVAVVVVALTLILLVSFFVYRRQERRANHENHQRNERLALILQASHVRIWTYDVTTQIFTWMDENGRPQRQYTTLEFSRRYHAEDFERLREGLRSITDMETDTVTLELKAIDEESHDSQEREFRIALSVLHRENGRPTVIIGTKSDITEEKARQQKSREQFRRYQSIFNTSMIDMVYYDQTGDIANMNERAQHTFNMDLQETIREHVNLKVALEEPNLDLDKMEVYHMSEFLNTKGENRPIKSRKLQGKMVYELQVVPMFDENHKFVCAFGTGRDVTEVADSYHRLQASITNIKEATKLLSDYMQSINYVLGVGGVRMANYSPDTHVLTIYRGLNVVQHSLTQTRVMTLVNERTKRKAMRALNSMDSRTENVVEAEIETCIHVNKQPLYLQFRFIPTYDKQGRVESYFGMCRDQTEMKVTELQLERETMRAREIENLKNSFLRNMSYEIRTPLNAVVGFAELFELEHDPEDEVVFVREIKENSAHLLHLINDILFLSRLDAHMIEINKAPIDFAKTFESHCHIGWANEQREGVKYVAENHFDELVVNIDDANMGRIIEQIVANAAQHTTRGTVRARYDYINGKLIVTVEDTGEGMSPKTLANIYERFATGPHRGTGLGLPICKDLASQLGGSIDVSSELGKGTTVWITMPCEAITATRKNES